MLSSKSLDSLPARIQRFRMRLLRFQFTISHVPGKEFYIADTLSRAPASSYSSSDEQFYHKTDMFVRLVTESLPISEERLRQIAKLQEKDPVCQQLKQYCLKGWPVGNQVPSVLTAVQMSFHRQTDMFVRLVTESLPFSEERYQQIVKWQEKDPVCQQPKQYCLKGWPAGNRVTIQQSLFNLCHQSLLSRMVY
jgi:hypothetical protein